MSYKILNVLGEEQTQDWLSATWGATVDTSLRRSGKANFQLTELREMEGPAAYIVRVVDKDGQPWSGQFVGRYYPSAPNSWPGGTKPDNVPAPSEAVAHVVFATTDENGRASFGVGSGDYAGPGDGVTMLWMANHYAGTDVVKKLGMLPNTNHRMLSPKFQYMPGGPEPDPDPDPDPEPDTEVDFTKLVKAFAAGARAWADKVEETIK